MTKWEFGYDNDNFKSLTIIKDSKTFLIPQLKTTNKNNY